MVLDSLEHIYYDSRILNIQSKQPSLKPVDLVVALELAIRIRQPMSRISASVGISVGEVHNSLGRLMLSGLIDRDKRRVLRSRLDGFLEHGAAIAFPPTWLPAGPGIETAVADTIPDAMASGPRSVVWPRANGPTRGRGLLPLFPGAPDLAERNPSLYRLLVWVDVIRTAGVRERTWALSQIRERLNHGSENGAQQIPPLADGNSGARSLVNVAKAIGPLLNRVVFAGRAAAEVLRTETIVLAPVRRREDATLRVLTSYSVDRVGTELRSLGLERVQRGPTTDRWRVRDGLEFDLEQVSGDDDQPGMPWIEYALLLTNGFDVGDAVVVRVTAAHALLALLCNDFLAAGQAASDSACAEDLVVLVALRPSVVGECASAPAEIRNVVRRAAAVLLADTGLSFVIARTLPDAAVLHELTQTVVNRIRALTQLT